jgi:hypothetical protein
MLSQSGKESLNAFDGNYLSPPITIGIRFIKSLGHPLLGFVPGISLLVEGHRSNDNLIRSWRNGARSSWINLSAGGINPPRFQKEGSQHLIIPSQRLYKERNPFSNQGNPSGCKIDQRSVFIEDDETAGNTMALIFNPSQISATSLTEHIIKESSEKLFLALWNPCNRFIIGVIRDFSTFPEISHKRGLQRIQSIL